MAGNVFIVAEAWLEACDQQGGLADPAPFALGGAPVQANAPVLNTKASMAAAAPSAKKGKKAAMASVVATAAPPLPVAATTSKGKGKAAKLSVANASILPAIVNVSIPVETGLLESGKLLGSLSVHEDYAWLGNQVGISGSNNNNKERTR